MSGRSPAERETIRVGIGYALFSGTVAAVLVYAAVAGAVLVFSMPAMVERLMLLGAAALGAATFALRVAFVLMGLRSRGQPSQPGRTNPDS
ncbi:hypothetical protein HUT18_01405 [Streptomyces sp. NA04227]|uniref:DUF6332 family protein n=1 Tax=Streptomyces sp. NA04227 TaxID=2742136 RepID=UPI0015918BDA|nr:DUF6332 family protein [Streptomyces sp. NA04227]QKW05218.1 hypothetical protein HUT18_01405 [Streptomyces sp. NA04227]